jgi:hypothetical protein
MRIGAFRGGISKRKLAALDALPANVMVADDKLRITYTNPPRL